MPEAIDPFLPSILPLESDVYGDAPPIRNPRLDPPPLAKRIENAYRELSECTDGAYHMAEAVAAARRALTAKKQQILRDNAENPKALGANEAAREATIAALTAPQAETLINAEADAKEANHALAMAEIDVQAALAQLRILEATNRR